MRRIPFVLFIVLGTACGSDPSAPTGDAGTDAPGADACPAGWPCPDCVRYEWVARLAQTSAGGRGVCVLLDPADCGPMHRMCSATERCVVGTVSVGGFPPDERVTVDVVCAPRR